MTVVKDFFVFLHFLSKIKAPFPAFVMHFGKGAFTSSTYASLQMNDSCFAYKPPSAACGRHLPPEGGFPKGSLWRELSPQRLKEVSNHYFLALS
jgi:hypothetical protein